MGLLKEANWARKYRSQADARRARLQASVREAERDLSTHQTDSRISYLAGCVANRDLGSELSALQASEAREKGRAEKSEEMAEELEARKAALLLDLMKEEHQRSYLEQRANSAQLALGMSQGAFGGMGPT